MEGDPVTDDRSLDARTKRRKAIRFDVKCRKCGYNLRGLHPFGDCPECGAPVPDSMRPYTSEFPSSKWVRSIAIGIRWFICAWFVLWISRWLAYKFYGGVSIVMVIPAVLLFGGCLRLTEGEPPTLPQPAGSRKHRGNLVGKLLDLKKSPAAQPLRLTRSLPSLSCSTTMSRHFFCTMPSSGTSSAA